MMKKLVFTYGFLCIMNTLQAADIVLLQGLEHKKLLGKYMCFFEDKTTHYSIQDITSSKISDQFKKTSVEIPRLGLISSAYWFRIDFKNQDKNDREYILWIDDPTIYQVDFYLTDRGKVLEHQVGGIGIRPKDRSVKGNRIAFRLRIASQKNVEVYFRIESKIYTAVPVYLLSNQYFNEMISFERSLFGVYYGILFLINILCLLFLIGVRNPTYLYLIFYAVLSGIVTGTFDGFTPEYLHFLVRWTEGYHDIPVATLSMISGLVFIMRFSRLEEYSKRLYRICQGFIILSASTLVFSWFFPNQGFPVVLLVASLYVILVIGVSAVGVRHKVREAYFVLAAFNMPALAIIVVILSLKQVLPLTIFTMYSLHIAYIFQLTILFLGVADRILALKEELRKKEIDKEHEKQQLILLKNHELEEKVKLRTRELGVHQARLSSLIENTSDVIWSIDMDYRFLTLNQAARKFFKEEMGKGVEIGDYFFDILEQSFIEEWRDYYTQAFASNAYKIVKSYINPFGESEYYEYAFYTIREADQNIQGFSVFRRDITESRLREEKIRESESKLNAIIHNNHDAIWLVDRNYQIIHYNTAFILMCRSVLGKEPSNKQNFLKLLPNQADYQIWEQRLEKAFSGRQSTFMDVYVVGWDKLYYDIMTYPIMQEDRITGVTVIARNVTDKENAQIELRKSEERFNLAVLGSQDGIWDWDIENNQVYYSPRWKSMLGYTEDELPGNFETFSGLLHPDDLLGMMQALQNYFIGKTSTYELEIRMKHKNETWRWIKTSGIALFNEKGMPYRMAGSHVDITQRKEDEIELLKKEANLRTILDNNDDAVYLLDENLCLVDFNTVFDKNIRQYFGGNVVRGLNAQKLLEVFGPEAGDDKRYERALAGEFQKFIHEVNMGGKSYILETRMYPIRENNKIKGVSVFTKDITEAKKAEDRLERALRRAEKQAKQLKYKERMLFESEMMLQTVINKLPYSIFWKDKNAVYFGCNMVFAKLAGLQNPHDILRKTDQDISWTPSQRKAFNGDDRQIIAQNTPKMDVELQIWDQNQECKWFSVNKIPLRDPEGKAYGILGMCVDISERKKQSQFLEEAKEAAEEAARAKAFFLSTMTHEIRTPLNAVIGLSHLLLQESPKPEQIEYLKTLEFSAGQLMALVNDILDYNKIEAQKIELERITFSLDKLLYSIQKSFEPRVLEKGIELKIIRENTLPNKVIGDQARLSQILNNLISNAIKFTKKGYVSVKISLLEALESEGLYVLYFEVQDTGIGIPEDKLEDIFNKFSQASSDISRKFGGTGLGLSITKKLLELYQSNIEVKSELGVGSVFSFKLKLGKPDSAEPLSESDHESLQQESPKELEGLRVLFVEDHPINQMVGSKFLKNWGVSVDFAENGLIALEKLELCTSEDMYHLILMDLQMPELDGYETARLVRRSPKRYLCDIPIIALTASMIDEVKEDIFAVGMNDYISKPFNPNDLFNTIARFSQQKNLKKENITLNTNPMKADGLLKVDNIKKLVGNDQEYLKELIDLYIDFLDNFAHEYREILEKKDLARLNYMAHKSKPSIEFLELENIDKEVNYIRILMENQDYNPEFFKASIQRIDKECLTLIKILMNYSNLESV